MSKNGSDEARTRRRQLLEAIAAERARRDAMPFACEDCGLGHEQWQVECDDCGGPVEKKGGRSGHERTVCSQDRGSG